jgi:hypothetical protein
MCDDATAGLQPVKKVDCRKMRHVIGKAVTSQGGGQTYIR